MRKFFALFGVALAAVVFVGCTPVSSGETAGGSPDTNHTQTSNPSMSPSASPSPLVSTLTRAVQGMVDIKVYQEFVGRDNGAVVVGFKFDLTGSTSFMGLNYGDGVDLTGATLAEQWTGLETPVAFATTQPDGVGVGIGLSSIMTPAILPWGQTRSFVQAVKVPLYASILACSFSFPSDPDGDTTVDVPLSNDVLQALYAQPGNRDTQPNNKGE